MAYSYPFRMSSNTATILVIDRNHDDIMKSKILIGIRSRDSEVHPGETSMPGGFMEAKFSSDQEAWQLKYEDLDGQGFVIGQHPGESLEETALRELLEETCTVFTEDQLTQYYTCSKPGLDPRAHVVNLCFYLEANAEQIASLKAGDDLEALEWWDINTCLDLKEEIAFNHRDLMQRGIKAWLKEERFKELEKRYGSQ